MSLINIITLVVIVVLVILLVVFLFFAYKKQKQVATDTLVHDLNLVDNKYKIKPINSKELSINIEKINGDNVYFCNKAVIGQYDYPDKIIHDKNINLNSLLKNNKLNIFYHYYTFNFGRQKFIPLNKIDLLITKNNIHLYHPLDPEVIRISKIKSITFFWERNPLIKRKEYFSAVSFMYKNKHYFLLFQTYNEALKFIVCINNFSN